jgi:hypothetical protein
VSGARAWPGGLGGVVRGRERVGRGGLAVDRSAEYAWGVHARRPRRGYRSVRRCYTEDAWEPQHPVPCPGVYPAPPGYFYVTAQRWPEAPRFTHPIRGAGLYHVQRYIARPRAGHGPSERARASHAAHAAGALMCERCRQCPPYWRCWLKWSETGETVDLCDGCMRVEWTVNGSLSSKRPLHEVTPAPEQRR